MKLTEQILEEFRRRNLALVEGRMTIIEAIQALQIHSDATASPSGRRALAALNTAVGELQQISAKLASPIPTPAHLAAERIRRTAGP
jgi:hypothetical protein